MLTCFDSPIKYFVVLESTVLSFVFDCDDRITGFISCRLSPQREGEPLSEATSKSPSNTPPKVFVKVSVFGASQGKFLQDYYLQAN